MVTTGIVRDLRYLQHITSEYHPENHHRLEVIYQMLDDEDMIGKYVDVPPRFATKEEIGLIHTSEYISRVAATADKSHVMLDPDTQTSPKSYDAARLAVGGVLECIDGIMSGDIDNGVALVRPPGHHAESDRGMGFCLFNNVAVGARYARERYSLERILIVDWDLHHGNGTQNAFYNDSDVLYFSTHQFPHYPGTGSFDETGAFQGEGFTINVPLSGGQGNEEFAQIFSRILKPVCLQYKPQFILVSAGFDTYSKDPLGAMKITPDGFARLARILLEICELTCQGKLVFVLEGGYHLEGLKNSVKAVLKECMGESLLLKNEIGQKESESPFITSVINRVVSSHKDFWTFATV
ncbi:MAG: histone deacetylase [Thermodesulfobacteriota bacterium]|nr:histone deacetylase [Thermodesulfobacteriota bacterium]